MQRCMYIHTKSHATDTAAPHWGELPEPTSKPHMQWLKAAEKCRTASLTPPPPCTSYANVHNYYGPYAYCSLDKGVACAQHTQLPTHTCAGHMC